MLITLLKKMRDIRFFSRQAEPESVWQRIAWWEMRRLPYNLIVGSAGMVSLALILISGAVAEHVTGRPLVMPDPPLFLLVGILIYAVLANLCYTGGWIAELLVVKVWEDAGKSFGVISFTLGIFFSLFLTLTIGGFFSALNVIQILLYLSGYRSSAF